MKGDQWQGVPPHWAIYVTVADCDERVARAVQLGGKVCVPPTDIPEYRALLGDHRSTGSKFQHYSSDWHTSARCCMTDKATLRTNTCQ